MYWIVNRLDNPKLHIETHTDQIRILWRFTNTRLFMRLSLTPTFAFGTVDLNAGDESVKYLRFWTLSRIYRATICSTYRAVSSDKLFMADYYSSLWIGRDRDPCYLHASSQVIIKVYELWTRLARWKKWHEWQWSWAHQRGRRPPHHCDSYGHESHTINGTV